MAITPEKFTGARIQPVGAGRMAAQQPNSGSNSKKSGQLLRDLEETKLEGDPLTLLGEGTGGEIVGADPTNDQLPAAGNRLFFWNDASYKVGLGIDNDRTLWCMSIGGTIDNSDVGGFDWWSGAVLNGSFARKMRLTSDGRLTVSADVDVAADVPNARLRVDGPLAITIGDVSLGFSIGTNTVPFLVCDAAGGGFTITLPPAANARGVTYTFKRVNSGANTVVIDGDGAETIDGAATKTLGSQYACLAVISDGGEWHVISTFGTVT